VHLPLGNIIKAGWAVLILYWVVRARDGKASVRSESFMLRLLKHWVPLMIGAVLIFPWHGGEGSLLRRNFLPPGWLWPVIGALMVWSGVLFASWTRAILGRNWSAVVQVKQDHELVERGPYRWSGIPSTPACWPRISVPRSLKANGAACSARRLWACRCGSI
jgi:protein-S-isoprenylcysteine O-methyltransferase Ste14